ncbi:LapA family protein [Arthrobacter dokdonensis]|uniref:LapA family protein n=1 Tax=Arthrobacter dokdonellae TaxID=2211210 RepID=UPI000DE57F69|nr:lipopolysaccharide assembly protein LapA domain-containing protein [Arthrobacter dokdonellae]
MTEETNPEESTPPHPTGGPARSKSNSVVTRASMMWVATAAGLLVLVLLIIFILQNQESVTLHYFGLNGTVSIGVGLFIGAVGGGIIVAIAGTVRIIQLRARVRRNKPRL